MMESSVTLLRVRGVAIGAHWSWLLVFAIVVWSLATELLPATYPGLEGTTYLLMALATAVLFFGSVLAHELGHALRGLREGLPIEGITLWLLGGVARLGGTPPSAGSEFRVAIAGPLITLAAVAVFGAIALAGDNLGWAAPVQGVADYLTRINGLVLAFNLVPALPLDGGRVLRSWLWHRQRSFVAATRSAARAGQAFGVTLIVVGMLDLLAGATLGGIWLAFLGWFLLQASQSEAASAVVRQALGGSRVRDVMSPDPPSVDPRLPVADLLDDVAPRHRRTGFPVAEDGRPVGYVSVSVAGGVAPGDRAERTVGQVMSPLRDLVVVDARDDVLRVLPKLEDGGGRALVTDDGRLVGLLTPADVARAVELGQARPEPPARRAGIAVWIVVGLVIVGAGLSLWHPPYVVLAPGNALDVGATFSIDGVPTTELSGEYLITSVHLGRPSALRVIVAALRPDREVLALDAVVPEGVPPDEYREAQQEVFRESRLLAAAAAARSLGLEVSVSGDGARVVDVIRDAPAAGVLERGDVIVAVNGDPVERAGDLGQAIRSQPVGARFALTVERDGQARELVVRSRELPDIAAAAGIGVAVETLDLQVDLPFDISFSTLEVGGPSAGLAYAAAIADVLAEQDYARGRIIAATGTIDLDGDVGRVGGIEQKAAVAEDAGADLFLVPEGEVDAAAGADDLAVRGVTTLEAALRALEATAGVSDPATS